MHIAFEDQLVQKIMPKLRGIDTRGKSKSDCLDVIQGLLLRGVNGIRFNLDDDFTAACELGYGQFMWQSANYLNSTDELEEQSSEVTEASCDVANAVKASSMSHNPQTVSVVHNEDVSHEEEIKSQHHTEPRIIREAPERVEVPSSLVDYAKSLDKPLSRRDIEEFLKVDKHEAFKILQAYNTSFRG